ncbi:MAG: hypothetical protein NZ898_11965 [Myxococcota bacterium]|nr:hypothetical protein [Myxococcota bacterium]MDW8360911.1 hypothetical protein [Myxococcales bacterium]
MDDDVETHRRLRAPDDRSARRPLRAFEEPQRAEHRNHDTSETRTRGRDHAHASTGAQPHVLHPHLPRTEPTLHAQPRKHEAGLSRDRTRLGPTLRERSFDHPLLGAATQPQPARPAHVDGTALDRLHQGNPTSAARAHLDCVRRGPLRTELHPGVHVVGQIVDEHRVVLVAHDQIDAQPISGDGEHRVAPTRFDRQRRSHRLPDRQFDALDTPRRTEPAVRETLDAFRETTHSRIPL